MQVPGALAQARGSVEGIVVDESSGAPIVGATVSVPDLDRKAVADAEGHFLLEDLPPGTISLRIVQPGSVSVVEQVDVNPADLVFLRVMLPRVDAMLRELFATVGGAASSGNSEAEVSPNGGSRTAVDLLSRITGLNVDSGGGAIGAGTPVRTRGISSILANDLPSIYLDGVRISSDVAGGPPLRGGSSTAFRILQFIPAETVESIRVLRGPAAASQYPTASSGVILIETRRGEGVSR
jgi:outer membrane receptor protein involved in Fe transport